VVLSVWFTWGIWATGVPVGDDTAAHYVRTQYAIDNLFANGLLDGWQSSFGLGYQEFLFVGPGFTMMAALLKVLSLGGLSTVDAGSPSSCPSSRSRSPWRSWRGRSGWVGAPPARSRRSRGSSPAPSAAPG
jgi:hypothetical protein